MTEKSYTIVKSDKPKKERQGWNEYFMNLAKLAAERSTCDRANVGAVIVNSENRIVATGYNGSVGSKTPHCDDIGHVMRENHCIATQHAEINCLCYCAKEGIPVKNSVIYVTHFPCLNCTKALIQAGIKKIYYSNDYRIDDYALELLNINDILYEKI
ncbi:deoxycytidylate deaminase [Clostridium cellulovorans]|uniref:CMP/dCMP deaminase zinc-binding n=1 Tax=Clostridium cellulovorans (strain ATCC 35296 / DSM 3052 / OCM 3 / 743B) TaxID=573061 RepID=D9SS24_CLOC7|nr:cytidine/deoxycytidylate deaminase family protein [Clostridium cellulovorans]ADL52471.1 CMP/dCMP deaminase zinc-binding [Clostridium cellulovorans 743B]